MNEVVAVSNRSDLSLTTTDLQQLIPQSEIAWQKLSDTHRALEASECRDIRSSLFERASIVPELNRQLLLNVRSVEAMLPRVEINQSSLVSLPSISDSYCLRMPLCLSCAEQALLASRLSFGQATVYREEGCSISERTLFAKLTDRFGNNSDVDSLCTLTTDLTQLAEQLTGLYCRSVLISSYERSADIVGFHGPHSSRLVYTFGPTGYEPTWISGLASNLEISEHGRLVVDSGQRLCSIEKAIVSEFLGNNRNRFNTFYDILAERVASHLSLFLQPFSRYEAAVQRLQPGDILYFPPMQGAIKEKSVIRSMFPTHAEPPSIGIGRVRIIIDCA